MQENVRYVHNELEHNLNDPRIIVPIIIKKINPRSVVDFGCGIGTFLRVFQECGVDDILGLDGEWVDKNLLQKHIELAKFKEVNLEQKIVLDRKFDLAICLEVIEHLNEIYADELIHSLTQASDIVLFSAAIPGQGGQNHINEQWPEYWKKKFEKNNYVMCDVVRPIFWNKKELAAWYKQNIFLVVRKDKLDIILKKWENVNDEMLDLVHPDFYAMALDNYSKYRHSSESYESKYYELKCGKASGVTYLKMICKWLENKLKF